MKRIRALCFASLLTLGPPGAVVSHTTTAYAAARPGGGSSFSGGSRSSGSSSSRSSSSGSYSSGSSSRSYGSSGNSGDSGDLVFGLIGLLFSSSAPAGLSVLAVVAVGLYIAAKVQRQGAQLNWQAGIGEGAVQRTRVRAELERLRAEDPNFSLVLLEDFLYALYAQAHTLRGGGRLAQLSAYVKPEAASTLTTLGNVREVRAIIVGAMRYLSVDGTAPGSQEVRLVVELESNYSEIGEAGGEQGFYACERWTLTRAKGVMSRTPHRARVFTCPSCGAPLDSMVGGRCQYCQATVDTGQFDWVVQAIEIASREARGPLLTGTTAEQGTDLPSVIDPDLEARFAELSQRDPQFAWGAFQSRVAMVFDAMQVAWSNREWAPIRPFVSDNLFQMLGYWIEAYRREKLRNITEGARIENIELARVSSDKFYDALTVRVLATGLDYTIADEGGRVVGGNRSKPRRYTEYWTLIRGVSRKGPARDDPNCPSCGAPLHIEMAGTCQYCRAKVTSGEFDWVLSRIEQDEVYEG